MYNTQEQKDTYVEKLFSDVTLFEWDVLHVSSNTDRIEVMEIIAQELVQNTLKYELNFLHLHDVDQVSFKNIKSTIFKQMIDEWLTFCKDVLMYPKEDAIAAVKEGERIKFIYHIVNDYFDKFQRFIYSEIVDTFFDLFARIPITKNRQILIERVLQSKLNISKESQKIHKFTQVFNRVKIAQTKKNHELNLLNAKIKDLMNSLPQTNEAESENNEVLLDIEDCEYDIQELEEMKIYNFDTLLAGLRDDMISSMIHIGQGNSPTR